MLVVRARGPGPFFLAHSPTSLALPWLNSKLTCKTRSHSPRRSSEGYHGVLFARVEEEETEETLQSTNAKVLEKKEK